MYRKDRIKRQDDLLKMTGNEVLDNAGTNSHLEMLEKTEKEYIKCKESTKNELSEAEKDFIKQMDNTAKVIEQEENDKK